MIALVLAGWLIAQQVPLPPPGSGTAASGLVWTDPKGWVKGAPSSAMRRAQYRIPGPGGDGELVVFYFGPGQGGDAQSNAERWASQFLDERGQPATASLKTRPLEANGIAITVVEARGAYQSGSMMGSQSVEAKPGYALLGAILTALAVITFSGVMKPKDE